MIPFKTTAQQRVELFGIATAMSGAGLPDEFVANAVELANVYEGTFELMKLWMMTESAPEAREEIVAHIQEAIDERTDTPGKKPYVRFNDLSGIGAQVIEFKKKLREKVEKWGGISKLANATGIPQPSLSRFFSSASMPRRTTLYRIAEAMNLPETEIATEWHR